MPTLLVVSVTFLLHYSFKQLLSDNDLVVQGKLNRLSLVGANRLD